MTALKDILYIDDEDDIRTVAEMALSMVGGLNVVACSSGAEGLALARKNPPQMVLLDVMMPGMDGPETLLNLRFDNELAHIPVAFMTAKIRPDEVEVLKEKGAIGVIAKPFDPMTLADQVKNLWDAYQKETK